jgi:hypothetical protein
METIEKIFLLVLVSVILAAPGIVSAQGIDNLDELQPPHDESNGISCPDCHVPYGTAPNPPPDDWITINICWSCHIEGGTAQYQNVHTVADTVWCQDCHNPHQHQDVFPQWYIYDNIETPNSGGWQLAFRDSTDFIHGETGVYQPYDGICEVCHTQTAFHRNNSSGNHTHNAGTNCVECHQHENGFMAECGSCHDVPPSTGAHLTHFGGSADLASYGEVDNLSTATDYIFQCGNCHALDSNSHNNGTVDVELYNPDAPTGSLKSLNPPEAAYTPGSTVYYDPFGIPYTEGTCSNVYCHSKTDWSAPDPIPDPIVVSGVPVLDPYGNLTYPPYSVTESKVYNDVNWGDTALDCNACHRNNPQTTYPEVHGGVGNSHGWIDDYGYEDLHAWNMSFDPLICRTCHYNTVTADQTWSRDAMDITTYDDVPIADKSYHVNGVKDVAFNTVDPIVYNTSGGAVTYYLTDVSYDLDTKICSSVPCHLAQPNPEWGKPYRWWNSWECNQCHQMDLGGGKSSSTVSKVVIPEHQNAAGGNCLDCHDGHRKSR